MANQLCRFRFSGPLSQERRGFDLSGTIIFITPDPNERAVSFYSSDMSVWRDGEIAYGTKRNIYIQFLMGDVLICGCFCSVDLFPVFS